MAIDMTPFRELRIAPRAVFDALDERAQRPRFMLPDGDGGFSPMTWAEFADQIRSIALALPGLGLVHGSRAAIFAPNRVEWASAALAIQAAGGVMVPIYPTSTGEQAHYVLEHSDARVLFVDTQVLVDRIAAVADTLPLLQTLVLLDDNLSVPEGLEGRATHWSSVVAIGQTAHAADSGAFDALMDAVSLDQPGMMLYTSGTSGRPKGVPLTHRNVAVNGRDWLECNGPTLDLDVEVDLLWLPMSHIFGFGEMCLGNTLGFTTWMSDPRAVLGHLQQVKPTVFMSVPSVWEKLAMHALKGTTTAERTARLDDISGGRLKFCLSGGAGLKVEVKELFWECGRLIIEGYGLTEASPTLTLNRPGDFRFDSVGKPLPSVELKLAEDGEILARGPSIFHGYHKNEAATAETFTDDGWLLTGDIGKWTDDGFLQIVDRKKDILVTRGGKNIPPANIEVRFNDDALLDHVVVYGDGHKYLVAGVWANIPAITDTLVSRGLKVTEDAIRRLVQERIDVGNDGLARYMTIKKFELMSPPLSVEGGLLTPTMKVKRKAVYAAYKTQLEALYGDGE